MYAQLLICLDGLCRALAPASPPLFLHQPGVCEADLHKRLPSIVAPYARRTTRLTDVFTLIGLALGGEAGKRLAKV